MISKKNLNTHMHIHTHIKERFALNTLGSVISKKNLKTHMHIHTSTKELLTLNTVHDPVFLHTRTQRLRVAPNEKISGCNMCTFAIQIKTIK